MRERVRVRMPFVCGGGAFAIHASSGVLRSGPKVGKERERESGTATNKTRVVRGAPFKRTQHETGFSSRWCCRSLFFFREGRRDGIEAGTGKAEGRAQSAVGFLGGGA